MPHSCAKVANYFIQKGIEEASPLTHMQVQKLVYIAHGVSLGLADEKLIFEEVAAWPYGPVIPVLFDKLKGYGKNKIENPIEVNDTEEFTDKESQILDLVWSIYGKQDGIKLSALTHQSGTPWDKVKNSNSPSLVIGNDLIREHYIELVGGYKDN